MMNRFLSYLMVTLLSSASSACDGLSGLEVTDPKAVSDLAVQSVALTSVQLRWTQVGDGSGKAANYLVAFGSPTVVLPVKPESTVVVGGTMVGSEAIVSIGALNRSTPYSFIVVSFRGNVDSLPVFGKPSPTVNAQTEADFPGDVVDLTNPLVSSSSFALQWTQVDDGTGRPANYAVLVGSPTVNWTGSLAGATEVIGSQIGVPASFTFGAATPSTAYQVVVASMRGRLSGSPTVGSPSTPLALSTSAVSATTPFFSDNFDSGTRTNANGFTWSSSNRVDLSTLRSFSGQYALRFRYGPDPVGSDSDSEQRFNLGRNLAEYWVDYMIFVPLNFVQRNDAPNNNKFFMTWRDIYSDVAGGTWRIGYEYQGTNSGLRPMSSRWDFNSWTSAGLNHPQEGAPLIGGTGPVKLGQWNRIRLQFRAASSRTASDGIMRMWVNNDLFAELASGRFHNFFDTPADVYLRNGYFLGWSNSGFTEETLIFIDDVKFYAANPGW